MSELYSAYYNRERIAEKVAAGAHRAVIGGLWNEIGQLQIDFLRANCLRPIHRLLDIGCGSLRLGVRAVDYLNSGVYWGTDINQSLLDAGWEKEILPAGLAAKLPRENLIVDADFAFEGVPRSIDFAIAQSVFTHLPFNHMRLCLANLATHIKSPCTLFATVFIAPDAALARPCHQQPGGVTTHPHRDPYHYAVADLAHAALGTPWKLEFRGDWGHPRNQKMAVFTKAAS